MATTVMAKIKVQELTKYGFKANDKYVNYSKQLDETSKTKIVPGAEFDCELYVADSGKEYLNKILRQSTSVAAVSVPNVDVERAKKITDYAQGKPRAFTPKFNKTVAVDNSMSKGEWAAKDTRISRQGSIQAAVKALASVLGPEVLFVEAAKLADQMLEYVNRT